MALYTYYMAITKLVMCRQSNTAFLGFNYGSSEGSSKAD